MINRIISQSGSFGMPLKSMCLHKTFVHTNYIPQKCVTDSFYTFWEDLCNKHNFSFGVESGLSVLIYFHEPFESHFFTAGFHVINMVSVNESVLCELWPSFFSHTLGQLARRGFLYVFLGGVVLHAAFWQMISYLIILCVDGNPCAQTAFTELDW